MNILLVDDDDRFLDELRGKLTNAHTVATASNATDALVQISEKVDIVLLDMNLRETEGAPVDSDRLGGVRLLKKLSRGQVSKTIFMSKYTDADVVTQAAQEGCRYFMFKSLKEEYEDAFYDTLRAYIDAIGSSQRFRRRLAITIGVSIIITVGVFMTYFEKSLIPGLFISLAGVVINLLSFYPKSLR